jgi:hypothetical protein
MNSHFNHNTKYTNQTHNNDSNNNNRHVKLLQQFPKLKFSYELKSYKKVSNYNINDIRDNNSVYFLIPKGKKYFVWFKNDECLFLELDNNRQIVHVACKKPSRIFPNDTILYGTHFYYRPPTTTKSSSLESIQYYFTIENIHYYNGVNVDATQSVFEKLKTLHLAFTTVSLEKIFQVEIGLPHIDTCLNQISTIKPFYQVYCIQKKKSSDIGNQYQNIHLNMLPNTNTNTNTQQFNKPELESKILHDSTSVSVTAPILLPTPPVVTVLRNSVTETNKKYIEKHNSTNNYNSYNMRYKVFIVSADIQNDVYHLVDPDASTQINGTVSDKLVASIPDYKTSVMMNALFRNIKENRSLDALEESDDEDEFENTNVDKFVDLTKKIRMKCVFNYRFKKWTPVDVASK